MIDREKVIKGLECCITDRCEDCPYEDICYGDNDVELFDTLARDALALLKAQEPIEARLHLCESCMKEYPECDATIDGIEFGCGVGNDNIIGCPWYMNRWKVQEPVEPSIGGDADGMYGNWWHTCGVCHEQIDRGDKYCRWCGMAVKWDG